MSSLPLQFLQLTVAGWMSRDQQRITEYLLAENAVLRQQVRGRRSVYTDAQRRQLGDGCEESSSRTCIRRQRRHCCTRPNRAWMARHLSRWRLDRIAPSLRRRSFLTYSAHRKRFTTKYPETPSTATAMIWEVDKPAAPNSPRTASPRSGSNKKRTHA